MFNYWSKIQVNVCLYTFTKSSNSQTHDNQREVFLFSGAIDYL